MRGEFSRGKKIADLIRREISVLLQREIEDPRLGMVTVNEATVSRDLAFSDVYFTVLDNDNAMEVEEILNRAGGFLRSHLAKVLGTRTTPKLRFHYDSTMENSARLNELIDAAIAGDAGNHPVNNPEKAD